MPGSDHEKSTVKAWLGALVDWFADLLDINFQSRTGTRRKVERWSLRKAIFYIVGVSLAIWGATFLVVRFVLRLLIYL
jgi:hypothetical protein